MTSHADIPTSDHVIERCPSCGALEGVIRDEPKGCDHCEHGGKLEPVVMIPAEVTDEMVERARAWERSRVTTHMATHRPEWWRAALAAALSTQEVRDAG